MRVLGFVLAAVASLTASVVAASTTPSFTMEQVLNYPVVTEIVAADTANRIAWVRVSRGVRNVWIADGPDFKARQVTPYKDDDGQEITHLTFSPDGKHLLYVRGGDHDANWPAEGNLAPDPNSAADQPKVTIWAAALSGGAPIKLAEGDEPAISATGQLAYVADDKVWTVSLDGKGKPQRLFFDRGKDHDLRWSPDGKHLAFVSDRDDHSFIGIFTSKSQPIGYLAPSTSRDFMPRWSFDGKRIAFVRRPGKGGAPQPLLKQTPEPWAIWVADAASGDGRLVWASPNTLLGSYPDETAGEANLNWAAGNRLVFTADLDNWPHLYSVPADGRTLTLLTPGSFMVEHVAESKDHRFLIYSANTGSTSGDFDRRHLFRVSVDKATPEAISSGETLEWSPVAADSNHIAFIGASAQQPPAVAITGIDGKDRRNLIANDIPRGYPGSAFVTPRPVTFRAADGTLVHGQLFQRDEGTIKPGIIFVHGGPPRQMLLGWHYMDYYSNAYAVNQYLANHGFAVLSVNYRLGIGYGHAFHHPDHAGPAGAAEYQDVLAGAEFLRATKGVDRTRIGIWGGSYGGYLTGLALARNSDIFKAGVDLHGVHDWSRFLTAEIGDAEKRYEQGDREQAMKVAFESSPDADVARWKSPVLLIQGDDDRNVMFQQMVDLVRRLEQQHVRFEELVLPNEIHGFLRYANWLMADKATAAFLTKELLNDVSDTPPRAGRRAHAGK